MARAQMRRAEEDQVWKNLLQKNAGNEAKNISAEGVDLDISRPCIVIGGRNGAGKSRVLRAVGAALGDDALYLDLHHLCEQALIILRSRDDFDEMTAEVSTFGPDEGRREDIQRVIGRVYDSVEWFALEVEPGEASVAERFRWGGTTSVVPYFDVTHHGKHFSSREMGLGEFSIHFLFWILEQYREKSGLTLLLDEPDAYLPPVGSSSLLIRLLQLCTERGWSVIVTTHSAETMERALEREAFVLLRLDESGATEAIHSKDEPGAADGLMTTPPIRNILFVEDESAWILCTVLMEAADRRLPLRSSVIWGKGSGYMMALQEHFPRTPASSFVYAYAFDGDQRGRVQASKAGRWAAIFLPTDEDPDTLFVSNRDDPAELAERLNVPQQELVLFLDGIQHLDPHDWVNDLAAKYGRPKTLRILAEMWVKNHEDESKAWQRELTAALR